MASSSGTSSVSGSGSGSSLLQNSGSEEDLQVLMDQRKRKRMISNRESARRSRMRKQKHLDDLVSQVTKLRKENQEILTSVNITTQQYLSVEAENSVLRAQIGELSNRLESLNEIVGAMNSSNGGFEPNSNFFFFNPLTNNMSYMNQPIMASSDILQYWHSFGFGFSAALKFNWQSRPLDQKKIGFKKFLILILIERSRLKTLRELLICFELSLLMRYCKNC